MKNNGINYFAACSSPEGFVSFFSDLYAFGRDGRVYILKGGAGTGKSTLMKMLALDIESRGFETERIYCSSDPKSLDGVLCRELKFCIIDGTKPHVVEPAFPGAVENIINLGEFWDKEKLRKSSEEIIEKTGLNSLCHERCSRFLSAAGKVRCDTQRLCEDALLEYKIHAYAQRFAARHFKKQHRPAGKERKIFLSAFTPEGNIFFDGTVGYLADEIILFDDKTALASGMLFEEMKNYALKNGYDVFSAFCPLQPYGFPEHIIIPELSLAFIRKHPSFTSLSGSRTIHCDRFIDKSILSARKNRLLFNHRIQNELLCEAVFSLGEAKRIHDEIESIYIPAMDFSSFEETEKKIIAEIM